LNLNQGCFRANFAIDNQTTFENIISAVEHFARDPTDLLTARSAFGIINRMVTVWGGPDVMPVAVSHPPLNSPTDVAGSPMIPGFDTFIISRFSPLSWAIPSTPGFKAKDPNARQLIYEIAGMQQEILKKTGQAYLAALSLELQSMGAGEQDIEGYMLKLRGENKGFRDFLSTFLGRG
jgi:exportin-T